MASETSQRSENVHPPDAAGVSKTSSVTYQEEDTSNDSRKYFSEDYLVDYDEDFHESSPLSRNYVHPLNVKREPLDSSSYYGEENNGKSRRKWTEAKEIKLAEMWEQERILYDTSHPGHRQSDKRQEALKRIATELDMNEKDVLIRMQTIRTNFTKIYNQQVAGIGDFTRRQLFMLQLGDFLAPHVRVRESTKKAQYMENGSRKKRNMMDAAAESLGLVMESISSENAESKPKRSKCTTGEEHTMTPDLDKMGATHSDEPSNFTSVNYLGPFDYSSPKNILDAENYRGYEAPDDGEEADRALLKERNTIFASLATSVAVIARTMTEPSAPPKTNPNQLWSQLLAHKLEDMEPRLRERFKLEVDKMACDALDGLWTPQNSTQSRERV